MPQSRRGFLSKILSGSIIMGTAGIFSLKKDIVLADDLDLKDIKQFNENDLLILCNDMLNAMDGQPVSNHQVQEFVDKHLKRGSVYEGSDTGALDVHGYSEIDVHIKNKRS